MQIYSDPARESNPYALPDMEVFFLTDDFENQQFAESDEHLPAGWYWQSCFPGCLPDGDPIGPIESSAEAVANAQELSVDE